MTQSLALLLLRCDKILKTDWLNNVADAKIVALMEAYRGHNTRLCVIM